MKLRDTGWAFLPALIGLGLGCAGCASVPDTHEGRSTQAIISGTPDDTDSATVWIVGKAKGKEGFCSGVVVAPHVVLTAAHCVRIEADYSIFLGNDYTDETAKAATDNYVAVTEVHGHPEWDPVENLNDIGVLITESAIPREPASINRTKLTKSDVGEEIRIVGFGQTAADDKTVGRRHSATTTISAIDATGLAVQGTPNICLYDSGGPTFMKRGDTEVVVGIHSLTDSASCDGQGVDTRVDPYASFIDGYVATSATPDAGTPIKEDAGVVESDAGVAPAKETPAAAASGCSLVHERAPSGSTALGLLGVALLLLRRVQGDRDVDRSRLGDRARRSGALQRPTGFARRQSNSSAGASRAVVDLGNYPARRHRPSFGRSHE